MSNSSSNASTEGLWVFGYGSLCWKPGFDYKRVIKGFIQGYSRVFWQGNETHRGTPGKPGRVATLIADQNAETYGVAFQLVGQAAISYLTDREITLGGYVAKTTTFIPLKGELDKIQTVPVLMYLANESSTHWLGPTSTEDIAEQVVHSSGPSGHNVEYVLKTAEWMKKNIPGIQDDHLFSIEKHVRRKIAEYKFNLRHLMGEPEEESEAESDEELSDASEDDDEESDDSSGGSGKQGSRFSSHVCDKCLRCVKM